MQLSELVPKDCRIVEFGAVGGALANRLFASGYERYLSVVPHEHRRHAIVGRYPGLERRVVTTNNARVVRRNNAELLILSGSAALHAVRYRSVRHARYAAITLAPTPLCVLAVQLALLQCLLRRFEWPRIVGCGPGDSGPKLLLFRIRHPRPYHGVRRFIPHRLGVEGFLRRLQASGARHAVLRWFEPLPQIAPGEDIDLLVDDAALESVRAMLDEEPGIQPIDLYSVSGLPGADFRNMPYYPPYLAAELLDRAALHNQLCRVPAPREHFLSLAYHALYHKGTESGLVGRGRKQPRRAADHDYSATLQNLSERLGIETTITLEGLDAYLDSQGWRPPHDMLVRLARRNKWVRSRLERPTPKSAGDDRLAVFLIREASLKRGGLERAAQLVEAHGFQILARRLFDAETSALLSRSVRGGNWGRGPWPVSGGPPVAAIAAYDPAPIAPTRKQRRRFPFLANARLLCKEQIRDAFNEGFPPEKHCNVVHSSDNGREAIDYLRIAMPDALAEVTAGVESLRPHRLRPAA